MKNLSVKAVELEIEKISAEIVELAKKNFIAEEIEFFEENVFNNKYLLESFAYDVYAGILTTEEGILCDLKDLYYSNFPEKRPRVNVLSPEILELMEKTFTEEEIEFIKENDFSDKDVIKVTKNLRYNIKVYNISAMGVLGDYAYLKEISRYYKN